MSKRKTVPVHQLLGFSHGLIFCYLGFFGGKLWEEGKGWEESLWERRGGRRKGKEELKRWFLSGFLILRAGCYEKQWFSAVFFNVIYEGFMRCSVSL